MKKIYLSLFLSILWTSTLFAATEIDGINYELNTTDRTATVVSSNSYSGAIVIPETVVNNNRNYAVVAIAAGAFSQKSITSVVIPSSVTSIGASAFYQCTSLNAVTIGEGVQTIGESAFFGCSALLSISVPGSVSRIEKLAFGDCVVLADVTLNEGITYIGDAAFGYCPKLTSITIPSTITSMGMAVFYNCQYIKSIVWNAKKCVDFNSAAESPFSRYYTKGSSYNNCSATHYDYTFNSSSLGYTRTGNYWTTSITFGDEVEHIPAYLCYSFTGELRNITIPDNVKTIGDCAFYGCNQLVSVKFGSGLTVIGKSAFSNCSKLASVKLQDNVSTIETYAFAGCSALNSLTLGKGIKTIGSYAFSNCTNLITLNNYTVEPPVIESSVFNGISDLMAIDLFVREKAFNDYKSAAVWKNMHLDTFADDTRVFSLTLSSADNTKGATSPSGKYDEGDDIVISALAKDGYHFTKWNDGNRDNPRLIKLTGDLTYTAYFAAGSEGSSSGNAYAVNINGENCSLNISGQYPEGSVVTMEAVPDECLEFKQWSDGNKENPRTITVADDTDLTAEFNKVRYTITDTSASNAKGHVEVIDE